MARKRTATVSSGKGVVVVTPPAVSAPVRRRRSGGAIVRHRKGGRRRMPMTGWGSGAGYKNKLVGVGVGGVAYGFIEKTWPNLPGLPFIGRSGTIALACYFFGGKSEIIRDVGIAAAAIAGYSLGKEGKISGPGEEY